MADTAQALKATLRINPTVDEESGLTMAERSAWDARTLNYRSWYTYYSGEVLSAYDPTKTGKDGKRVQRWPLEINPDGIASRLHQQALIGEQSDFSLVPAPVTCLPEQPDEEGSVSQARAADRALRRVEYENGLAAVDTECMLLTQVYGGIAQRIVDSTSLPSGVAVTYLKPEHVWFRWEGTDYLHPTDAWVRYTVTPETAQRYGVKLEDDAEYLEHWTAAERRITIDGSPAKHPATGVQLTGKNPFGLIPIVYIPHFRDGDFWGTSLIPGSRGLMEELNQRMADWGDAAFLDVHDPLNGVNIPTGFPQRRVLPDGRPWYDWGQARLAGSSASLAPTVFKTVRSGQATLFTDFVKSVEQFLHFQLMTAAPAYGQLEGTQRSGQTVYSLGWLMWSHINVERMYWTQALIRRADIMLTLLSLYKKGGVGPEHINLLKRVNWAPQVPLDRTALVNEMTTRVGDGTIPPEEAMENYGDIANIEAAMAQVKAWKKFLAEIETPPGLSDRLGGARPVKKESA